MKYGIREICNVVFRAKQDMKIGSATFKKGQPVFFMDTAKTSSLEGAATTVYATGGRGNVRLVAWEGEKTVTFTVEDALLSPISFAMLSGAGVVKGAGSDYSQVHAHQTSTAYVADSSGSLVVDLTDALMSTDKICNTAPIFVMGTEGDGSINGTTYMVSAVDANGKKLTLDALSGAEAGQSVLVDFYVIKDAAKVTELQVDAGNFGGYFYVEADTLFRAQIDGTDYPANLTMPNVKIQSNWTFSMAATGDPSTFTFTMDVMPGYTYFDAKHKVLVAIQVIEENELAEKTYESVMAHRANEQNSIEGKKWEEGPVPGDNLPNTETGWANLAQMRIIPKKTPFSAKASFGEDFYAYDCSGTYAPSTVGLGKFASASVATENAWNTAVASGLYVYEG